MTFKLCCLITMTEQCLNCNDFVALGRCLPGDVHQPPGDRQDSTPGRRRNRLHQDRLGLVRGQAARVFRPLQGWYLCS